MVVLPGSLVSACLVAARTAGTELPGAAEASIEVAALLNCKSRRTRTAVSSVYTGVSSASSGHLMRRPVSKNHVFVPGSSTSNRFLPVERKIDGYSAKLHLLALGAELFAFTQEQAVVFP